MPNSEAFSRDRVRTMAGWLPSAPAVFSHDCMRKLGGNVGICCADKAVQNASRDKVSEIFFMVVQDKLMKELRFRNDRYLIEGVKLRFFKKKQAMPQLN